MRLKVPDSKPGVFRSLAATWNAGMDHIELRDYNTYAITAIERPVKLIK